MSVPVDRLMADAMRAAMIKDGTMVPREEKAAVVAPRTVRVRILVAVDDADDWSAVGSSHIDKEDARRHLNCSRSARYSWVEADVPLPEPEPERTIQGEVIEDKGEG